MDLIKFKDYLRGRVRGVLKKLNDLENYYEFLHNNPKLDFKDYGGYDIVRQMYFKDNNITGFLTAAPVPYYVLERHLVYRETQKTEDKIDAIRRYREQIEKVFLCSNDTEFTHSLYPNDDVIREIMLFTGGNEALEMLESLLSKVQVTDSCSLMEADTYRSIKLLSNNSYFDIINCCKRLRDLFERFINMDGIDTQFKTMLGSIESRLYDKSINTRDKIYPFEVDIAKKFLRPDQLHILFNALSLDVTSNEYVLIKRCLNDLFALLRELDRTFGSSRFSKNMLLITSKFEELDRLYGYLTSSHDYKHNFYYLTDENYYPTVCSSLDGVEETYYDEIKNAFNSLPVSGDGTLIEEGNLSIRRYESPNFTIIYGVFNGKRVLISVTKSELYEDKEYSLDGIREIRNLDTSFELHRMNRLYEQMVNDKLIVKKEEIGKKNKKER